MENFNQILKLSRAVEIVEDELNIENAREYADMYRVVQDGIKITFPGHGVWYFPEQEFLDEWLDDWNWDVNDFDGPGMVERDQCRTDIVNYIEYAYDADATEYDDEDMAMLYELHMFCVELGDSESNTKNMRLSDVLERAKVSERLTKLEHKLESRPEQKRVKL